MGNCELTHQKNWPKFSRRELDKILSKLEESEGKVSTISAQYSSKCSENVTLKQSLSELENSELTYEKDIEQLQQKLAEGRSNLKESEWKVSTISAQYSSKCSENVALKQSLSELENSELTYQKDIEQIQQKLTKGLSKLKESEFQLECDNILIDGLNTQVNEIKTNNSQLIAENDSLEQANKQKELDAQHLGDNTKRLREEIRSWKQLYAGQDDTHQNNMEKLQINLKHTVEEKKESESNLLKYKETASELESTAHSYLEQLKQLRIQVSEFKSSNSHLIDENGAISKDRDRRARESDRMQQDISEGRKELVRLSDEKEERAHDYIHKLIEGLQKYETIKCDCYFCVPSQRTKIV
jgi:chromosome segregation ATPase